MNPIVSVVIPVYKQARFLRDTIASLLVQTIEPEEWEAIIVNDGSPDNTEEEYTALADRFGPPRFSLRYIKQENHGVVCARNRGIEAARGEFILPLDGDDQIAPTYIETTLAALDADPTADFCYTDIKLFDDHCYIWRCEPWDPTTIGTHNYVPICSMIRAKTLRELGGYRENAAMFADWDLWLHMAEQGRRGIWIPEPLFRYRRHASSWLFRVEDAERLRLEGVLRANNPKVFRK